MRSPIWNVKVTKLQFEQKQLPLPSIGIVHEYLQLSVATWCPRERDVLLREGELSLVALWVI